MTFCGSADEIEITPEMIEAGLKSLRTVLRTFTSLGYLLQSLLDESLPQCLSGKAHLLQDFLYLLALGGNRRQPWQVEAIRDNAPLMALFVRKDDAMGMVSSCIPKHREPSASSYRSNG